MQLAHVPTPLEPLDRLSAYLGGPRLWIKRDDCTGLATGGNKARKLEPIFAEAREQRADTIISAGAIQSNHARQVAAACAKQGLACVLVLTDSVGGQPEDYREKGNISLMKLLGAEIQIISGSQESAPVMERIARDLAMQGHRPYIIPVGGTTALGVLAYAEAFLELSEQLRSNNQTADAIVLATGTGGTQAGLLIGAALDDWQGQIFGMSVGASKARATNRVNAALAAGKEALQLDDASISTPSIHVSDAFVGPGYGLPSQDCLEAIHLLARHEGILLDPTYTGKAMAGLIATLRYHALLSNMKNVVFWHTGGNASLDAYPCVSRATI